MFKKPNFFIIGAPKCGTTSLTHWLSQHPNIYMSELKEPHYFNVNGLRDIRRMKDYETLFEDVSEKHQIVGEASTHYLFSEEAVPNILEYNALAKFLVCIRNPVEMVQALHGERVYQGTETVTTFEKAWHLQNERLNGNGIPLAVQQDPMRLQYGEYCKLGKQLNRLRSIIDKERIHVVLLDDMAQDPKKEYSKILKFLDLPDIINTDFPVLNSSKRIKLPYINTLVKNLGHLKDHLGINFGIGVAHALKQLNLYNAKRDKISTEMEKELKEYFKEDIELLGSIIGRNVSRWLKNN